VNQQIGVATLVSRLGHGSEEMIITRHRPPHIYLDDTYYFVTVGTFRKMHLFNSQKKKVLIRSALERSVERCGYLLKAWVILSNHFHILFKTKQGRLLPRFLSGITGRSAIELNKLEKAAGRKCWYQYWDRCPRGERDFWTRVNYIHYNPVKHGYAARMEDYPFSSYGAYLKDKGQQWLTACFMEFPIRDFLVVEDEF
jgi:putative transposase